jgi:TfoX/Sxy family transcriptional regulator of competence genes
VNVVPALLVTAARRGDIAGPARVRVPDTRTLAQTDAMASDPAFIEHVCDQLRDVGGVTSRKMFGEYAIYVHGKVVALVCDDSLYLKPTDAGRRLLGVPTEGAPYPGARPHFVLDEHVDDRHLLSAVVRATADALPAPKPKKPKGPRKPKKPA